uniref:Tetraspanin 10 n=1 Tax=Sinocyclocheilus anshuiensis TaxID=1608454 RepID=A0A671T8V8_9TELE
MINNNNNNKYRNVLLLLVVVVLLHKIFNKFGQNCLNYLLVTSNLLFSVLGLVTLVVGLWGLINKESFAQEKISGIGTDPMLLFCFLGLVLALLSLMGCVGALRENMCLLQSFLAGQIAEYLRSGMLAAMVRYQDDLDLRFITDEIQTGLQCCGADTYRDWEINVASPFGLLVVFAPIQIFRIIVPLVLSNIFHFITQSSSFCNPSYDYPL